MKLAAINKSSIESFLQNYFVRSFIFLGIYLLFARLGLCMATINETASPVWPVTGIACAILFLYGLRYWPSIAIGAFFINLLSAISISAVAFITIGNTLEAVIGAIILLFFSQKKYIDSPHIRTIAIVTASLIASSISAMTGTLSLILSGTSSGNMFDSIWITWWTGDVLAGLMVLPLVFAFTKNIFNHYELKKENVSPMMIVALISIGSFLCWLMFIRPEGAPYLFFIFPFLLWCAAQTGEQGVAVSTILISAVGIMTVQMGYGVFIHGSTNANLVNLQLFLGSVAVSSLMMADLKRMSSLKQPSLVLFFSWLFAGLLFLGFCFKSNKDSDDHLKMIVDGVEPMIQTKVNLYFAALQSGARLFAASENVSKDEWRAFLENDHFIKNELSGVTNLGVVFRVPKNKMDSFAKKKKLSNAEFKYHLIPDVSPEALTQNKLNSEAYVVTFIEPLENNKDRIGLDLASEEQRKYYADLAMDTGMPTVTGKLTLSNVPSLQPSMLFFYPFYSQGEIPDSVSSRRERLVGWIYAPVRVKEFFENLFNGGNLQEISYRITDEFGGSQGLISSSKNYDDLPKTNEMTKKIRIGNHDFLFKFKGSASFYSNQDAFSSWVGAIAAIISLLLGTLIASLQTVKKRALSIASKTTKELLASEELWKFALEGAGDSVWDWDVPSGRAIFSKRFKLLMGYSEDEIKDEYTEWEIRIHPDDLQKVTDDLNAHFKGRENFVTECRLRCKNGTYKWVMARGMIVSRDLMGKARRMVGTIADISERKETEHEMERQRSKLHSIFEGSNDALMLISEDGFFDCNMRTLKLFGLYSKEEFISHSPADFSPAFQNDGSDSFMKSQEHIRRAFEYGVSQHEWTFCKKNGKIFPAEVLFTAFSYDGKMVLQACVRDITERKQAEAIVISQREKLVASAKMSSLGEMAGGIAHEINNPLTIIIGKTSLLKRRLEFNHADSVSETEKLNHSISDELTNIQITAKRIGSIIRGLRSFSRNAENDLMEKVQVSTLVNETLEFSRERFKFHSIDLKLDMDADESLYVNGRAAQLLQVLVNLLNNAYDAVENLNVRWVELKVSHADQICRISVTDSGDGIDPEVLEKIMMPFFTTKEVGKGTGLGLSISKGIIEDHKGKLYYDTTCANTSFVIELPLLPIFPVALPVTETQPHIH
ncbi:MAG: CHASE domain-containing protein [Rhizobacter sp.]|nr:CHASE domain-containing protein [Bacteriovorax sp.]